MIKELSTFINEYRNYSEKYIPHYTVDIILAIISALVFLYAFIREETNFFNNSLSFSTVFLLNLATMILLRRNFTLSVKYLDTTDFSVICGDMNCFSTAFNTWIKRSQKTDMTPKSWTY